MVKIIEVTSDPKTDLVELVQEKRDFYHKQAQRLSADVVHRFEFVNIIAYSEQFVTEADKALEFLRG